MSSIAIALNRKSVEPVTNRVTPYRRLALVLIVHDFFVLMAGLIRLPVPMSHVAYASQANFWFQFDALIYQHIGQYGYSPGTSTAFFPIVPIVIHFLTPWGAMIFEQVIMYAVLVLLWQIASRWITRPGSAILSVWLFAINPCAVFYTSLYAELWTLFFALLAVYLSLEQRWLLVYLFSAVCSATQGDAILLGIFPLVMLVHSIRTHDSQQTIRALLWGISCAAGLIAYMLFLQIKFHDAFLFAQVQSVGWGAHWVMPWQTIFDSIQEVVHRNYKFVLAILLPYLLLTTGAIFFLFARGTSSKFSGAKIYVALGLLVSLTFATAYPLHSSIRILSVFFPIYLGLAQIPSRMAQGIIIAGFVLTGIVGTSLFVHGYFFQ